MFPDSFRRSERRTRLFWSEGRESLRLARSMTMRTGLRQPLQRDDRHIIALRPRAEMEHLPEDMFEQTFDIRRTARRRRDQALFAEFLAAVDARFEHAVRHHQ